jgi:hypothetical protein
MISGKREKNQNVEGHEAAVSLNKKPSPALNNVRGSEEEDVRL